MQYNKNTRINKEKCIQNRDIPKGVSTSTALYNSAGVAATWIASICSKLPSGWHFGINSEMGLWCNVPVINRMILSII